MFRPGFATSSHAQRWKESWPRLLAPLSLWICVSISLKYGYYGSFQMVLGPSSSRLVNASPIFVKQIEFKEDAQKGVLIYGFDQRPQLSLETFWHVSKYMIVGSYSHQGFSLWLNKGSKIHLTWEAPKTSLDNLQIAVVKGEQDFETLSPNSSSSISSTTQIGGGEAGYFILEDDKYYVNVVNLNPRSVIMAMNANVSSKMYDTAKASSVCSTMSGSCKLNLVFPSTRFVILTTPNNVQSFNQFSLVLGFRNANYRYHVVQADLGGWYIELSFVSRIVTYVAILGVVLVIIFLILKYLGVCNGENNTHEFSTITTHEVFVPTRSEQSESESDPLMPEKLTRLRYGTGDENQETGSSNGSSDELYDGKICVICYDEARDCFFVPCGHCATCYDCAQRIIEGETRTCPICRRLIHKVRKLIT